MVPRKLVARTIRALPVLLIPVVLAPLLTLVFLQRGAQNTFEAEATIWVLNPPMIQQSPLDVDNPYLTPAQRQAAVIRDLLQTDGFRLDIAEHAGLLADQDADLTPRQRSGVLVAVGRAVHVEAAGSNLLLVAAEAPSSQVAIALTAATIDVYRGRLGSEAERQSEVASDYFLEQLAAAEEELAARRAAVDAYVATNPGADQTAGDREYALLMGRVESQTRVIAGIGDALQSSHLSSVAAGQALAARFNVLDEPALVIETEPPSRTRQLGIPLAAGVLGLLLAGGYLLLAFYTDHSIYSREDLATTQVRFLGYTPRIKRRRGLFGRIVGIFSRDRHHARRVAAALSGKAAH